MKEMVLPHHHYGLKKKPWNDGFPNKSIVLALSLALNMLLVLSLVYMSTLLPSDRDLSSLSVNRNSYRKKMTWHGGHPEETRPGSCWCGADEYCMCTPNLAIDLIIASGKNKEYLWLVRRKDTNQLATMGGFVEVNETLEHAVKRELMEEMGVDLQEPPTLFGVYSDPRRDNRRQTTSAVYAIYLDEAEHNPRAGDDAKEVKRILLDDIEKHAYFADHFTILMDYRRHVRGEPSTFSSEGDFAPDIVRSTCVQQSALLS